MRVTDQSGRKPILLLIDTSTDVCSVAIGQGLSIIGEEIDRSNDRKHAALLPGMIGKVLTQAHLTVPDIEAVIYSKGPGSYTGLRVGLSTAQGMCLALNIPLIGVSTLLSLAHSVPNLTEGALIISMIDAGRDEVYQQLFDHHQRNLTQASPLILSGTSYSDQILIYKEVILVGDGADKAMKILNKNEKMRLGERETLAKNLLKRGLEKFLSQDFENPGYSFPEYIKAPNYAKMKS